MNTDLLKLFEIEAEIDERSAAFLAKAIAENDLPGFDYLEFKKSMTALKEMNMDEVTALKSSFKTAEIAGLSKEKLLGAAAHYLKVLDKEKVQFSEAMKNQYSLKVDKKKERIDFLKGGVADGQERISKIQAKIIELQQELESSQEELEKAQTSLQDTQDKFMNAYKSIQEKINQDISNFKELL